VVQRLSIEWPQLTAYVRSHLNIVFFTLITQRNFCFCCYFLHHYLRIGGLSGYEYQLSNMRNVGQLIHPSNVNFPVVWASMQARLSTINRFQDPRACLQTIKGARTGHKLDRNFLSRSLHNRLYILGFTAGVSPRSVANRCAKSRLVGIALCFVRCLRWVSEQQAFPQLAIRFNHVDMVSAWTIWWVLSQNIRRGQDYQASNYNQVLLRNNNLLC